MMSSDGYDEKDDGVHGDDEPLKATSDELADVIGIPEERRADFASALHAYVRACTAHEESEEEPPASKPRGGLALILGAKPKK